MNWVAAAVLMMLQGQERARELEKQEWLKERIVEPEVEDETFLDYGVWFRPQYFAWEDGSGKSRSQSSFDVRPWLDFRSGAHSVFVRAVGVSESWATGDSPDGDDSESDFDADVAFYQLDFGQTTDLGATRPVGWVRLGRVFHQVGSGLTFNGRGDGLVSGWNLGPIRATLFFLQTPEETEDLDQTRPNPDETDRRFSSILIEAGSASELVPYAFYVAERDHNDEDPVDPTQEFDWDADFWGVGLRGLFAPGVTFLFEGVIGGGERVSDGGLVATVADIESWALVAEVAAELDEGRRLEFALYAASGDEDRLFTGSTILGNLPGTDDETFTAFGFIPTGVVLNPQIANIIIIKAAYFFTPIRPQELFDAEELEVGLELFHYRKENKGGISDPFMAIDKKDLGTEINLVVNYTVLSDLSVTVRIGHFEPGDAPLVDSTRQFFLISTVYSY